MKKVFKNLAYTVVFTEAAEGGYTATVPTLPGCISEGDTFEEARKNIVEAIELYLETTKPRASDVKQTNFIVAPVTVSA